jgi:hypothetical protein
MERFSKDEATWEPVENFFHYYSSDLVQYAHQKGIKIDVLKHLALHAPT